MNNDLISRSALLEELKVQRGIERIKGVATINMAIDKGIEIAIRSIVSAPAVDAVEVVRREKCIHQEFVDMGDDIEEISGFALWEREVPLRFRNNFSCHAPIGVLFCTSALVKFIKKIILYLATHASLI